MLNSINRGTACWLILFAAWPAIADEPAETAASPARLAGMSYLDNGTIRLGIDCDHGGAITWLSRSKDDDNIVNNFDLGRQIQMSHYSGPVPFLVDGKRPAKHWEHLGWNPVQAGDDFKQGSRVTSLRNDGKSLYVQCIPLQWPLDNVPAECRFECWIALEENTAQVRCRLNNRRSDQTLYPARRQELPAIYVNAPLHRLFSYCGDKPFTGGPLTRIVKTTDDSFPWTHWMATGAITGLRFDPIPSGRNGDFVRIKSISGVGPVR